MMEKLLPDALKALWETVDEKKFTGEQFYYEQKRRIGKYGKTWERALLLQGRKNLKQSLLWELGFYLGIRDLAKLERRCRKATATAKREWQRVDTNDRRAVEQYYENSRGTLDELVWWHTLELHSSPLAYVTALQFARHHGCRSYLDFGAGAGSGAILFARHGFKVALADISSLLLNFSHWRLEKRRLAAKIFDMKSSALPERAFDFITAMDVFEQVFDPAAEVERLWQSLKPGGFLFGSFGIEENEDAPQHIVKDFGPTFRRMQELGFVQVWQDEWLWGHQVYQKT